MNAKAVLLALAGAVLAGCGDPGAGTEGPDPFRVLPGRPLVIPENTDALPPPTPGAPNRADRTPQADAIAALGGTPGAGTAAAPELVAAASRYEVEADARARSETDDDTGLLDGVFGSRDPDAIDPEAEADRFRQDGVAVPGAAAD